MEKIIRLVDLRQSSRIELDVLVKLINVNGLQAGQSARIIKLVDRSRQNDQVDQFGELIR